MMSNYFAIIPAAGVGKRFGGAKKKQFVTLGGRTLLERVVDTFVKSALFKKIVVVLPPSPQPSPLKGEGVKLSPPPLRGGGKGEGGLFYVNGGPTRAESVYKGLRSLNLQDNDIILIHDAVRPLVSGELVKKVVETAEKKGSAIPMLAVSDTVKETKGNQIVCTVDRKKLVTVQTPQGFKASILKRAYDNVKADQWDWTDEAMLVERLGGKVYGVEGEKGNIKITTVEDLRLAEFLLVCHSERSPGAPATKTRRVRLWRKESS